MPGPESRRPVPPMIARTCTMSVAERSGCSAVPRLNALSGGIRSGSATSAKCAAAGSAASGTLQ
jgi:hypothetical protein